jgi:signal transduction histidine kinase
MASFTPSAGLLWLTFYPFLIACVVLLARSRAARFDAGLVVDGLIGGVTLAAVAAEVGLRPLLAHTHQQMQGIAVDGIWVASDLAVLGVMAGCAALAASRGQRERWLLFGGGLVLVMADALSLYHGTAAVAGLPGGWRQTLVPLAAALMATAAIVPSGAPRATPGRPVVGFTAVFALIAVTLQALDLINAANQVAMVLSVLVLLAVAVRVSLSFRRLRESEQLRTALLDAEEQRRLVLNQMLRVEADERARIAEELHDDTVQVLTATLLSLDRQRLSDERGQPEAAAEAARRARDTLALALERTRRLMFELRPPLLEAHGLAHAVRDLVDHANHELGLEVEAHVDVPRYSEAFETLVYRIVREGVANVRRHARAHRLEVTLVHEGGALRGTISDDGRGFDVHRGRSTATAPACTWASTPPSSGSGSPAARSRSTPPPARARGSNSGCPEPRSRPRRRASSPPAPELPAAISRPATGRGYPLAGRVHRPPRDLCTGGPAAGLSPDSRLAGAPGVSEEVTRAVTAIEHSPPKNSLRAS